MRMDMARVAPELRAYERRMLSLPLGNPLVRAGVRGMMRLMPASNYPGVSLEIRRTPARGMRIFHPESRKTDAALLWIHGGGHLIGNAAIDDALCAATATRLGMVVVAANYRLSPEHPFPAAHDDCLAVWRWMSGEAGALGFDPTRIVVGGQSAGGGIAAGLVQRLHDEPGPGALAQWLFCPMLDDRTASLRELDALGHRVWPNPLNAIGWRAYLGKEPGSDEVPAYAVPARRADLSGLPPAWIGVGDIDLFYQEDRLYGERLAAAGTTVSFKTVPGAPHGFESWARTSAIAQAFIASAQDWLEETISGPASRPG